MTSLSYPSHPVLKYSRYEGVCSNPDNIIDSRDISWTTCRYLCDTLTKPCYGFSYNSLGGGTRCSLLSTICRLSTNENGSTYIKVGGWASNHKTTTIRIREHRSSAMKLEPANKICYWITNPPHHDRDWDPQQKYWRSRLKSSITFRVQDRLKSRCHMLAPPKSLHPFSLPSQRATHHHWHCA